MKFLGTVDLSFEQTHETARELFILAVRKGENEFSGIKLNPISKGLDRKPAPSDMIGWQVKLERMITDGKKTDSGPG